VSVTDRQKTNLAWLLTGAVIVLVTFNVYTNISHKYYILDHPHPITGNNNNKNESEHSCPFISTLLPSPLP